MHLIVGLLGVALAGAVLADAFQTVVVARQSRRLPPLTGRFYHFSWLSARVFARLIRSERLRDRYLGMYGPLSLLLLLGLWAGGLILAFAALQWSVNFPSPSFLREMYFSAASFFTLGFQEPRTLAGRYLMVLEAGLGFSFLGLVIGYLPVLYQSFSTRELRILLLDARAGTPPSALQFILRRGSDPARLEHRLAEWEEWVLELLESHLSYPMLAFYRSQHMNQSWLAALTTVTDVSALAMLGGSEDLKRQAEYTFAAARHALVHTAGIFRTRPPKRIPERLGEADFGELCRLICADPSPLHGAQIQLSELDRLRAVYEPSAQALSNYFMMALPPWIVRHPTGEDSHAGLTAIPHDISLVRRESEIARTTSP